MNVILEAKQLNKVYTTGTNTSQQVLRDVSMSIGEGEFVSVMGPSGSGKSTLLYSISGMDQITSGSIQFDGQDLAAMREEELAALRLTKMGFIFQQSNLLKNLNLLDNILLSAYVAKRESRKTINERAQALMDRLGIASLADHDITQASGGQLQRVAICRALINNPSILFGDEPTGALNSKATGEVMNILADINRSGTTILLVTHDAKVAAKTERVIFMTDGMIAGEHKLGKYDTDADLKTRERELAVWLSSKGF
ncbi:MULTISPECIES: ABC transporter ATP-binding protein [unclassified Paenibacillus]|uniref:ABC transporter ATP-binding protein n=1 Tax=unclassified Paenibacillus TaxID=185978 RepID=UPI000BA54946|nr:ABC transporter ATP-binding protein [Paenibacillus sp. 7541]PAK55700.1 ABC transporter ATP-binding protein [Paenibacillus sp. 7541]